jgi:GGDEF domain-containing protein
MPATGRKEPPVHRIPVEPLATFAACVVAAGLASWLSAVSWSSAALAAGVVFLGVTAVRAARGMRERSDAIPLALMVGGVCFAAIGAMLGAVLGGGSLVAGGMALLGAGVCGAGLTAEGHRWREVREQLEDVRGRLVRREGDVRAQAERIRRLDRADPTTGLMNRRGFAAAAEQALSECERARQPLALLLVDLGNPLMTVGDQESRALAQRVARAARQSVRASDAVGLWDPSLLAVLLTRCRDPEPARQRLREVLPARTASNGGRSPLVAGLTIPPEGPWPDPEGLMAAAQAALGAAREAPIGSTRPIWPMAWGLASTLVTHPASDHRDLGGEQAKAPRAAPADSAEAPSEG